jgi:hypothetical protein
MAKLGLRTDDEIIDTVGEVRPVTGGVDAVRAALKSTAPMVQQIEQVRQPSFSDQIAAAKDLQTLQAIGEAMDALPDGPEKENITQALVAKDAELAGQA